MWEKRLQTNGVTRKLYETREFNLAISWKIFYGQYFASSLRVSTNNSHNYNQQNSTCISDVWSLNYNLVIVFFSNFP